MTGLRVQRDGPFLRVTLARPERRNALDGALVDALAAAFSDPGDARAVVLSAEGPVFCAGADLAWMRASAALPLDENVEDARRLRRMIDAVDGCPVPVVGRIHGAALGGGAGLVACCDVAVCSPEAVFAFGEVKLGLVPAVVSSVVTAKIGVSAARRLFVTGEPFDAATARRVGLVHEIADDLDAALDRVLDELLDAAPGAVRAAKRLARHPLSDEEDARLLAELRAGAEGREGLDAFLEKRAPTWRSPAP